ncbi:DNA topoisomerase 3-beta-1-like protein, partial [Gonapodya prolifera JEL478]
MVLVLMVAEKPSLAESIAKILAGGGIQMRRGIATNVWEWNGMWHDQQATFRMTSVLGHVFSIDFPSAYNNWDAVPPIELYDAPTEKNESNPKQHVAKHLQVEAKGANYLVLWLDCDREGENICYEVMKCAQPNMRAPPGGGSKRSLILRARFSAITATEIKSAMAKLGLPNENEAKAVDVRQELDLKIGVSFTRFQTRFFQGKYGNLDSSTISFGPCQTPTLALAVARRDAILSFEPRSFWTLRARISVSGRALAVPSDKGRFWERNKANAMRDTLRGKGVARVVRLSDDKRTVQRPRALNTVEMLKAASKRLGMSPAEAMSISERLYTSGFISYPRTETTAYPPTFDLAGALLPHKDHPAWGSYVRELLKEGVKRPEGGVDKGDHPPITPTRCATEFDLAGSDWRLYDMITRTFIASLSPNLKYLRTSVTFSLGNAKAGGTEPTFTTTGRRLLYLGFASVAHWAWRHGPSDRDDDEPEDDDNEDESGEVKGGDELPPGLEPDKEYPLEDVVVREGVTKPPEYLTEGEMVGEMERLGIGTDASMALHIENIVNRRYVTVEGPRRRLVPTNLGIVLIHGYQKIDPELSLPTLRSAMEKRISLVASGALPADEVLKEELDVFRAKFRFFSENIDKMDNLFEATFSPLASSGRPLSKCGRCRRYLNYLALRPQRLHCRTCDETYAVPQGGTIKLYRELKCPLDGFELVYFTTGSKGKGFPFCPRCYSTPPIVEEGLVEAPMGCNQCPVTTCEHSAVRCGVCPCPEERCKGVMILDATSAPRWKICCNQCTLVMSFDDSVHNVTLCPTSCEDCGCRLLDLSFGKKAEREDLRESCIQCDEEDLAGVVETTFARLFARRRGRGRGRGRRGGRGDKGSRGGSARGGAGRGSTGGGDGGRGARGGGGGRSGHRGRGRGGRGRRDDDYAPPTRAGGTTLADFF